MNRKHCVKRRKYCFSVFSPFPTMFSKGFFLRVVESRECVVNSYRDNSLLSLFRVPHSNILKILWSINKLIVAYNEGFSIPKDSKYHLYQQYFLLFLPSSQTLLLNPFPNKPWFFNVSAVEVFCKHCGKKRNCL